MDYRLDKKIKYNPDSEFKNLYKWSLSEVGDGRSRENQIPWNWSFYFTVNALCVSRSISIEINGEAEKKVGNSKQISGVMYSGSCRDGETFDDDVIFAMFGTDRLIKSFALSIHEADTEEQEICSIWGCPSYEYEIDFRYTTTDDDVTVNVGLKRELFNDLVRLIEAKQIESAVVRLSGVSGFYSDWSPAISTNHVKILTSSHEIEGLEGVDIEPPKLGSVSDIDIYLKSVNNLNAKSNLKNKNFYQQFDEVDAEDETKSSLLDQIGFNRLIPDENATKAKEFNYYTKLISSLKSPLWLIFFVLVLILLK
jgi:hypothetical protein